MQHLSLPCLLIAAPTLQDENFASTVSLLVESTQHGALAFVVNRPSGLPLAAVLDSNTMEVPKNVPTWTGGPVGTNQGLILTNNTKTTIGPDDLCFEQFVISSSADTLDELINYARNFEKSTSAGILYPYRFLVGHAGWGEGQLEAEIRDGSWLQLPFDHKLVFGTPWATMYQAALNQLGAGTAGFSSVQLGDYLN